MGYAKIKELFEPIKQAMITGQGTPYKRPEFELRPLDLMLEDVTKIEMLDWYQYAFSREPLNGKFTDEQRKDWMEKSIQCGIEYCHKIRKKYSSKDPEIIASKMGMNISYPTVPEKTDRVLFAEYRIPNQITIYMDAVDKANELLRDSVVKDILTDKLNVRKLLLAHELFHYVEDQYKTEIFTQTEEIRLWSLGFLHNDSNIIALSEIAAMSFAKEMTGIPYAPYVMDVFLVYGYSPMEASGLYEEMMRYAGLEARSGNLKKEDIINED